MLELNSFEKIAISVMKQGHIPQHIAFIMDGNRRFGKTKNDKAMSGHQEGANTLKKCLLYCLQLGVKYASFYAFSLQNYKRGQQQVEFLMNLARAEFQKLSNIEQQDNILDIIEKNNVRVIIAGDLDGTLKSNFPDIREGFLRVQEKTKNHTKMTMYLCFAYDSVYEYNKAVELSQEETRPEKKQLSAQKQATENEEAREQDENAQINTTLDKEKVFSKLMIPHYIDIMIRTSGQSRLSNYMLMQVNEGLIYIQKNFWPAFNLFTLAKILLQYNYYYTDIVERKEKFLLKPKEQ